MYGPHLQSATHDHSLMPGARPCLLGGGHLTSSHDHSLLHQHFYCTFNEFPWPAVVSKKTTLQMPLSTCNKFCFAKLGVICQFSLLIPVIVCISIPYYDYISVYFTVSLCINIPYYDYISVYFTVSLCICIPYYDYISVYFTVSLCISIPYYDYISVYRISFLPRVYIMSPQLSNGTIFYLLSIPCHPQRSFSGAVSIECLKNVPRQYTDRYLCS